MFPISLYSSLDMLKTRTSLSELKLCHKCLNEKTPLRIKRTLSNGFQFKNAVFFKMVKHNFSRK